MTAMETDLDTRQGLRAAVVAMGVNVCLCVVKLTAGVLGGSFALIADGVESLTDLLTSLLVWSGLKVAARPPDENHPFGHGKAESFAGLLVGVSLFGAAAALTVATLKRLQEPVSVPEVWTLPVLLAVILSKEGLYRWVRGVARRIHSTALASDAVHQRADVITSLAAFAGISAALLGGPAWARADLWAALFACSLIALNALRVFRQALGEMMDESAPVDLVDQVREIAMSCGPVLAIDKCRVRKSGLGLWMDIHILVDGGLSVREGHRISHAVEDALRSSQLPIHDVVVHLEPDDAHPELLGG